MKRTNIQIHQDPEITWPSSLRMPFAVPEGYFDQFQEYLMSEINRSSLPKNTPFQLPSDQYFEEFPESLISEIKLKENISSRIPHDVPAGYFDGLAEQIFQKLQKETLDPTIEISKAMPHQVPTDYFNQFPDRILNHALVEESEVGNQNKAKVIPIPKKTAKKQWLWMAASIALLIGFLGIKNKDFLFNTSQRTFDEAYFESEIAKIPYEEIQDYLNIHDEEIQLNFSSRDSEERFMEGLNKISLDDLENYLGAIN